MSALIPPLEALVRHWRAAPFLRSLRYKELAISTAVSFAALQRQAPQQARWVFSVLQPGVNR